MASTVRTRCRMPKGEAIALHSLTPPTAHAKRQHGRCLVRAAPQKRRAPRAVREATEATSASGCVSLRGATLHSANATVESQFETISCELEEDGESRRPITPQEKRRTGPFRSSCILSFTETRLHGAAPELWRPREPQPRLQRIPEVVLAGKSVDLAPATDPTDRPVPLGTVISSNARRGSGSRRTYCFGEPENRTWCHGRTGDDRAGVQDHRLIPRTRDSIR